MMDMDRATAASFAKAAREGADLAPEMARLAEAYRDTRDHRVRQHLGGAIVFHFLRRSDLKRLARVVKGLEPVPLVDALYAAVKGGTDILPMIPELLAMFGIPAVTGALKVHLEGDPAARFPRALEGVLAAGRPPGGLLRPFLEMARLLKLDISPALKDLAVSGTTPDEGLLHTLREWASRGTDLESIAPWLERSFTLGRSAAVLSATALAFSAGRRRRWTEVDRLLHHASENVRWGAVRALSEILAGGPQAPKVHEIVDRLGGLLADPDASVRKQCFEGLEDARKAGHSPLPSPAGLPTVVGILGESAEAAEIVYGWVIRRREMALQVRDLLRSDPPRGATPLGAKLTEICEGVLAGRLQPPCSICSNLEDFECAGHEEDLPKEARLLVPKDADIRKCPECGARYRYGWDEQYEDEFGSHGTYDVRRLNPPPGKQTLDELLGDLVHPSRRAQRGSAGELTGIWLAEGKWDDLRALVGHANQSVRITTVMALARSAVDVDVEPLVAALKGRLTEPQEDLRTCAARALTHQFIRRKDYEALLNLLKVDNGMVRFGVNCTLQDAASKRGFDLSPLAARLKELTTDPDDLVSHSARSALKEVGKPNQSS